MPERVRGGKPENRGGDLHGLRSRAYLRPLRPAVQRCLELEIVLRRGPGEGHSQPEDNPNEHIFKTVHKNAEESAKSEETL